MSDDWISFHGRPFGTPRNLGVRVTLSPRQVMYLNQKAYEALGKPEAVEFLFHASTDTIGIRPIDPRVEYAFPLKPKSFKDGGRGYVIHAGAFMVDLKVRPERTIQFNKISVDKDGLMHLPLPFISAIGRGAR